MKNISKDVADWTDDERAQVRADAIYSGYDVIEDMADQTMMIIKATQSVRRKPKRRFT